MRTSGIVFSRFKGGAYLKPGDFEAPVDFLSFQVVDFVVFTVISSFQDISGRKKLAGICCEP